MQLESMLSVTVSIETVVLPILIPVQLLAVILQIVSLIECKQCLLFARIYEIERILEGGFIGWCYMLIAQGLLSIFGYVVLLSRRPVWGITFNSVQKSDKSWALFCLSTSSVIATCFVIIGWQEFCNTFKVVRCYHTPSLLIDWKSYTPKYSSCYNTYYYYTITEICLFLSSVAMLLLLLKTIWRK